MNNIKWMSLAVLAVVAACDPYSDVKKGTPNVVAAVGVNTADGLDPIEGTGDATTGAWTLSPTTCGNALDADDVVLNPGGFDPVAFFITFDRQIDGLLVQTSPTDCTPVGSPATPWLTVTPAPAAGNAWYSCYTPSSPAAREGGSVVVYQAPAPAPAQAGPPVVPEVLPSDGWADATYIPGATPIHITGTVAGRAIDVTVAACGP